MLLRDIAWQARLREQALVEVNAQADSLGESLHAAQVQIRALQEAVVNLQDALVQATTHKEARLNAAREEKVSGHALHPNDD
jgi:hypothetical protein